MSTHLGNGAHQILQRHPNYIWEQLAEDRLSASFIVDGIHLPASFLKTALRAKQLQRSVLVTDASSPAGELASVTSTERSEEHTSELQSPDHTVSRLLLAKK